MSHKVRKLYVIRYKVLPGAGNTVHLQDPFYRPLVPRRCDSFETQRALREDVFSGESVRGRFSRSPKPSAIDMPERLRTFDLVASHHQIKNDSLSAISASLR